MLIAGQKRKCKKNTKNQKNKSKCKKFRVGVLLRKAELFIFCKEYNYNAKGLEDVAQEALGTTDVRKEKWKHLKMILTMSEIDNFMK